MDTLKMKYYIQSTLRMDSFEERKVDEDYTLLMVTGTSEYWVRKSVNQEGWRKWLPRLSNLIINHHIAGGGSAVDVRLTLKQYKPKGKHKVADKQQRLI